MAFRRGNKSNKVPNVKLRPALPNSSSASAKSKTHISPDSLRSHDSGFDSEQEASYVDMRTPRPLRGVVLCATGIPDKMSLFKYAIELGAQPLNDLTDKVTHLLALQPGSAKYKCALQHNIIIMHPSWISECHAVWLKGDDVDLGESVRRYRLPIFSDVTLCLSTEDNDEKRMEIIRRVRDEGGEYVDNIERPVKVTHLLCTTGLDAITDKMQYALKFNKRKEANIQLVWQEWFWDSLRAGGRCDEEPYSISNPRPVRESIADSTSPPPRSSSPDILRDESHVDLDALDQRGSGEPSPHDEEEAAIPVKRQPAVTIQIWGSMLRRRGFQVQSGRLVRSPTKSREQHRDMSNVQDSPTKSMTKDTGPDKTYEIGDMVEQQRSVLASLRRAHGSATRAKGTISHQPSFKTIAPEDIAVADHSLTSFNQERSEGTSLIGSTVASSSNAGLEQSKHHGGGFFSGLTFRLVAEARSPVVKAALEEAGGSVVAESSDNPANFVIVRLVSGSKFYREEIDEHVRTSYRTECWLERCFSERRICPADEHISFTPLKVVFSVLDMQDINLSISGLEESEACWVKRLVRALGMNFASSFSRRTTHLLCPSKAGTKHEKAKEWNIPVVDMTWLAQVANTGKVESQLSALNLRGYSQPQTSDSKGKERLTESPARSMQSAFETSQDEHANHESIDHEGLNTNDDHRASFGQPLGLLSEPEEEVRTECISNKDDEGHLLTLAELRDEMRHTRIPSSKTPSPMKPPSVPSSPTKISKETSNTLQESVNLLLGKRTSLEDPSHEQAPRPKRTRPLARTRVPSRDVIPVFERNVGPQDSYGPFGVGQEDVSMLAAEGTVTDATDSVTYEDPAQSNERMRLMKLLETHKSPDVWELDSNSTGGNEETPTLNQRKKKQPTRRSTRTAGF